MPTTIDIESQRMLLGTTPVRKIYQGTNLLGTRIAELFANGEQGVWYDPSDLSTLFQDSAGTVPVTSVEQPVGLILDKSGNGNHASQPTATSRPILQQDENGKYYLRFDGVDDHLSIPSLDLSSASSLTFGCGMEKLTDAAAARLFAHGLTTATGHFRIVAPTNAGADTIRFGVQLPEIYREVGGSGVPAPAKRTLFGVVNPGASPGVRFIQNNETSFTGVASTPFPFLNTRFVLGAQGTPSAQSGFFNGHIYSLILLGRQLSTFERMAVERFINSKTKAY